MRAPRKSAVLLAALLALSTSFAFGTSVAGDMNGDGQTDLVIYNPKTRATEYKLLNGTHYLTTTVGRTLPTGMKLVAIADLNKDGIMDYLMVSSDGKVLYGLRNSKGAVTSRMGPLLPAGYDLIAAADMNRDGTKDLILFNRSSRTTRIMYMNPITSGPITARMTAPAVASVDAPYRLVGVADFDRDGIPDLVFAGGPGQGTLIFFMQGLLGNALKAVGVAPAGVNGFVVAGVADFNHDALPDFILTMNPGCGRPTQTEFLLVALSINYSNNIYQFGKIGGFIGPSLPSGWTLVSP